MRAGGTPLGVVFPHGCRALLPPGRAGRGREHRSIRQGKLVKEQHFFEMSCLAG